MFSSVGWLPFLNCAPAFPAKTPSPTNRHKALLHMFRMITLSPLRKKLSGNLAGPAPALHPNRDRRSFWGGVSKVASSRASESDQSRINCRGWIGIDSDHPLGEQNSCCGMLAAIPGPHEHELHFLLRLT